MRWITEDRKPCLTWREDLHCVEVMEAAHRSADENGAVITVPLYPTLSALLRQGEGLPFAEVLRAERAKT